jgi:hypothetical protein
MERSFVVVFKRENASLTGVAASPMRHYPAGLHHLGQYTRKSCVANRPLLKAAIVAAASTTA